MAIDYSDFAIPKVPKGQLRVEVKRDRKRDDQAAERLARAAVRRRDHGKCVVPGCKESAKHLHHITYRSRSRKRRWDTGNLCSLCPGHHGMVHAGRIAIAGDADVHLDITGDVEALKFKL